MSERLQYLLEKQSDRGLNYKENQELQNLMESEDLNNWSDM